MTEVRSGVKSDIYIKRKNRGAVKGESLREKGKKREEVDRIKWRWRRLAVGGMEGERVIVSEQEHQRRKSHKKWEEKWEGRSVGGLSQFSHLSHTQMFGEERRSGRRRGENRGAEKVKEATFEKEMKKRGKESNR